MRYTKNLEERWFSVTAQSRRYWRRAKIVVEPLGEGCLQPASVDVHLDKHVLVFRNSRRPFIDVREDLSDLTEMEEIGEQPFMLHPGRVRAGQHLGDDRVAG